MAVRTADGRTKSYELGRGLPVADFDGAFHALVNTGDFEEITGPVQQECKQLQRFRTRKV